MELGNPGDWAVREGGGNGDINKYSCESRSLSELGLRKHCDSANTGPPQGLWELVCQMCLSEVQGGQGQG